MKYSFSEEIFENSPNSWSVRRDRQREGRILWIEFHNLGTPLQISCTSKDDLENFCLSYREWSRYHITLCQSA